MIRKDVVIAIIATFCLTSSLFMITTSNSQVGEYNPWADYNEDGIIDIFDIVPGAVSFGAEGDPTKNVNVTNWPEWFESGNPIYPKNGNYTEEITVFSTDPKQSSVTTYCGGLWLNITSEFALKLNPIQPNFNITRAYLSITAFSTLSYYMGVFNKTRFWITINEQTEQFSPTLVETSGGTLTSILIPFLAVGSIHQGINTLQIVGEGQPSDGPWYSLQAAEIIVYIEYEYAA